MPRMSEAEKQKSHARILQAAAELFRENGIESTSVAEVMQAAGMTHGGFYRHFSGKDDLVAAAFRGAVDTVVAGLENATTAAELALAQDDYIALYLSQQHVADARNGCPMAALGSELVRGNAEVTHETGKAVARVTALLQGDGAKENSYVRLSLLIGAVTLARLSNDSDTAQDILSAVAHQIERV